MTSARLRWVLGAASAGAIVLLSGCQIEPLQPDALPSPTPSATLPVALSSLLPTLAPAATSPSTQSAGTPTPRFFLPAETGPMLFRDSFEADALGWSTGTDPTGSATLADGVLVLTVNDAHMSQTSLSLRAVPADYYAEVTARALLCGGPQDSFGLIFRASLEESYRLAVGCDGTLRFERLALNALVGASRWMAAPSLLPGAPAENRIGVLIQGNNFRLFANGLEVLAVSDPLLTVGHLGVFAKTDTGEQMTVAFDDLVVYSLAGS